MELEHLHIEATDDLPEFDLHPEGNIRVKGRSMATNAPKGYRKPIEWMNTYVTDPAPETKVLLQLDYVNSHSAKSLISFLVPLRKIKDNPNAEIKLVWKYDEEDEESFLLGDYLSKILGFEAEMISGE